MNLPPWQGCHVSLPPMACLGSRRYRSQVGHWYEVPTKASREQFETVSQDLEDLVRLATAAHRTGRGDLVWVSWVGGDRKGQHPEHGSTLLMLSQAGACGVLLRLPVAEEPARQEAYDRAHEAGIPAAQLMAPGHFDLKLIESLRHDHGEHLRACYLWPPCGGYTVHPSGCDKRLGGPGGRPATWDEPWSCPGLRREEDPHDREKWLCGFTKKGAPQWLQKVDLSVGQELAWRSFWEGPAEQHPVPHAPPAEPSAAVGAGGTAGKGSGARGSNDPPPAEPSAAGGKRRGAGGKTGRPPAAQTTAGGEKGKAGKTAATDPAAVPAAPTKRARREMRTTGFYRGKREWVKTADKAACPPPPPENKKRKTKR